MFTLVIQEKSGPRRVESFEQHEVTIGRVQDNDLVLPKGNISKHHGRIVLRDGKLIIVDLKSTNGTYVNGKRISSPMVLKESDKVYIGDYTLTLEPQEEREPTPPPAPTPPSSPSAPLPQAVAANGFGDDVALSEDLEDSEDSEDELFGGRVAELDELDELIVQQPPQPVAPEPPRSRDTPAPAAAAASRSRPHKVAQSTGSESLRVALPPVPALQARAAVFSSVCKALSPDQGIPPDDDTTFAKAEGAAKQTLAVIAKKLQGADTSTWARQIAREICGTGPLAELLDDDDVTEVFVNGPHQVLARRTSGLVATDAFFSSEEAVALVVRRMMAALGQPFDAANPIAEIRMTDGTRINAVHHSAAVKGPLVTFTRSNQRKATLDELVVEGVLSASMAEFLETCVRARRNVIVSGGAGSGVGTLLWALGATLPVSERIVTVQQVARLELPQPHVVTLEPRPTKGVPCAVTLRDLVANALRMRPDRLLAHEVSSGEAMELLIAMGGGQDGTLLSTYASSARGCLDRLETLMLMAGYDLPMRVLRQQIASSVDIIVQLTRFANGSYRVTEIAEVVGTEVDIITTSELFQFRREGFDDDGGVVGRFVASGAPPRFYEELQRRGEAVDMAIFRDG